MLFMCGLDSIFGTIDITSAIGPSNFFRLDFRKIRHDCDSAKSLVHESVVVQSSTPQGLSPKRHPASAPQGTVGDTTSPSGILREKRVECFWAEYLLFSFRVEILGKF